MFRFGTLRIRIQSLSFGVPPKKSTCHYMPDKQYAAVFPALLSTAFASVDESLIQV